MNGRNLLGIACVCFLLCAARSAAAPATKPADSHADIHDLKIGDAAPDFSLPGIDGKTHTLATHKDAKILIVLFMSNHCPDSHSAQVRIAKMMEELKGKGVELIAINPNNPDGISLDELGYSKYNDGFEDMKKYAAETHVTWPYLYDGETQAVAKAYGCLATPHLFIFDADRKLRYKGQFDDSRYADPATVKSTDAKNAVDAMLAGKPVPVEVTKPHGCSTKWMTKKSGIAAKEQKWAATPVDVETIDVDGVKKLRDNGTKKVRLFNVWATWCAPCRAEFPELVTAARKFGLRDFELITISVDDPKDVEKAKAFLEKQGAGLLDRLKPSLKAEGRATNSYLFSGADANAMMKALDPEWQGGYPDTVLVAPDGKIIWRHGGQIDGDTLRQKILDYMGPYYKP
jgi:peroxiredoxin